MKKYVLDKHYMKKHVVKCLLWPKVEEMKLRRILSVISGNIESGGVETYLKSAYENLDIDGIEIDLVVPGKIIYEPYAESFRSIGCNLVILNIPQDNWLRYLKLYKEIKKILANKKYDLIHINTGNLTVQTIVLKAAYICEVPERVSHSHGTLFKGGILKEILQRKMRKFVNRLSTKKLACSVAAAESLYGSAKGVIIAKNGIKVDEYKFDKLLREKIRKDNNWHGRYVIGSVGRLAPEKNYSFVIDVFAALLKKEPGAELVLVGNGEEAETLKNKCINMGIESSINLLGTRVDVPDLMQGFDVFILASKREALGIVNIEAQASGLPCVVSNAIPTEVNITNNVKYLSLTDPIEIWVDALLDFQGLLRTDNTKSIKANGYDSKDAYCIINEIYHQKIRGKL